MCSYLKRRWLERSRYFGANSVEDVSVPIIFSLIDACVKTVPLEGFMQEELQVNTQAQTPLSDYYSALKSSRLYRQRHIASTKRFRLEQMH